MKETELRLGNFVVNFLGQVFQVNTIPISPMFPNPKPIPLTEEWLLRFGFVKGIDVRTNEYDVYTPYVLKRYKVIDRFFEVRKCGSSYGMCSPWEFYNYKNEKCYGSSPHDDYYVHQLQNMYFALTGEELTLKESE